jgi:hypothetical protein
LFLAFESKTLDDDDDDEERETKSLKWILFYNEYSAENFH